MARIDPPYASDEATMLLAWLEYHRETMVQKVEGLTEEQARWRPTATANSLAGLIKHLAYVEQWWFHECFLGLEQELPWDEARGEDQDFVVHDDETVEGLTAQYRKQWERSNDIARAAPSLDDVGLHPVVVKRGVTMRWILTHMVEETARHSGHADITRELIDGSTGL